MSFTQRKGFHQVTHPQEKPGKGGEKGLSLDEVVAFLKYQEGTAAGELPWLDTRTNKRPLCFLQNIDAFSEKLCCHSHNSLNNGDTSCCKKSFY